tara:strand:+ start:14085 stop:14480 length:396 start_codon:yes stop_codon:yes gene_type:complete
MTDSNTLANKIGAITLFTEDREAAKAFYRNFLSAEPVYEDDDSAVFMVGDTMVNVLRISAVPELIEPSKRAAEGLRSVYTLPVDDVDKAVTDLSGRGIEPQSGPIDRPWGIRTANFVDPDGHLWELSCDLE